MAIVFRAVGSSATSTAGALSITAPTMLVGDVMFALIHGANNNAITLPAGWTTVQTVNNTAAQRITLAWKFVVPGDSGGSFSFTSTNDGSLTYGAIAAWGGQVYGNDPTLGNSTNSANASSATITWATLTPKQQGNLYILAFAAYAKNGVSNGNMSGTDPTFTNRFLDNTAVGATAALAIYDGPSLDSAATGARTMATGATAAVNDGILVELDAQDIAGGGGGGPAFPPIVRHRVLTKRVRNKIGNTQ
jgi:hypothetical protein